MDPLYFYSFVSWIIVGIVLSVPVIIKKRHLDPSTVVFVYVFAWPLWLVSDGWNKFQTYRENKKADDELKKMVLDEIDNDSKLHKTKIKRFGIQNSSRYYVLLKRNNKISIGEYELYNDSIDAMIVIESEDKNIEVGTLLSIDIDSNDVEIISKMMRKVIDDVKLPLWKTLRTYFEGHNKNEVTNIG